MNKTVNRITGLFLACIMIISIFTGCQAPSFAESQASSMNRPLKDGPQNPYGAMPERITMAIGRSEDGNITYIDGENSQNNFVVRHISDTLNVDYKHAFSVAGDEYSNKVSLTIAGGDLPDTLTVNESQLRQLVEADLIEDLTDVMNTYMSESLKERFETTDGYALSSATFDGKIMAIPNVNAGEDAIPMLYIRQDWLKECGLKAPKTMDDIKNIARVFKEKKMGGENTCGLLVQQEISTVGNSMYGLDAIFGLNRSFPELWYKKADDSLTYGSIEPETKTALASIRKLVEDGIIEKEFAVRDPDKCNELITSGKAGIFFGCWWNLNWPLFDMTKADTNVEWEAYIAPLDENGKYNTHMMAPSSNYQVVRKGYAYPEAVVKTANMQVDIDIDQGNSLKPNNNTTFSWTMMPFSLLLTGYDTRQSDALRVLDIAEGKMQESEYNDAEKNIINDPEKFDKSQYKAIQTFNKSGYPALFESNLNSPWAFWKGCYIMALAQENTNHVKGATYSYSPTMESKWATLQKLEAEVFLQILTGDKAVDEFDAFVDSWRSLGGNEITQELTEMINK